MSHLKKTHANKQHTCKLRKHLHQFNNTFIAYRKTTANSHNTHKHAAQHSTLRKNTANALVFALLLLQFVTRWSRVRIIAYVHCFGLTWCCSTLHMRGRVTSASTYTTSPTLSHKLYQKQACPTRVPWKHYFGLFTYSMCFPVMCWGVCSNSALLRLRPFTKCCICCQICDIFFSCVSASISTAQIQHSSPALQVCLTCRRNSRDVCSVDGQGDKQRDCPWPPNTRLEEDE